MEEMIGRQVLLKCPNFKCHLHLYGGLIPWDVYSPCQKWKKVKVLNLVVGGWGCIICCRRELAETVAALQQRRLLTEAKEYTLSIKVLGQLGPQQLSSRCFSGDFWFLEEKNTFIPGKGFWEVCFWMLVCLHRRSGKKIYLETRFNIRSVFCQWFLPTSRGVLSSFTKIINIRTQVKCEEAETQNEPSGEKHLAFLKDLLFCSILKMVELLR